MSWQDLWNFQSIEFVCAKSFRARLLIKGTKELNFKHIKRSTNICEQAENWDRDFWQMNFCSNICKKTLSSQMSNFTRKRTSAEVAILFQFVVSPKSFLFSPHSSFFGIFSKIFMNLFPVQNRFHGRAKYAIFIGPIIALPCQSVTGFIHSRFMQPFRKSRRTVEVWRN